MDDPAKVTRSVLQKAASIAALFLTTAVIACKFESGSAGIGPTRVAWTSDPNGRDQ